MAKILTHYNITRKDGESIGCCYGKSAIRIAKSEFKDEEKGSSFTETDFKSCKHCKGINYMGGVEICI